MQPPTVYEYAAPWPCKYGFEQNIFFAVCLQVGKVTSWTGPGSGGFIPPDHKNPPKWAPKCFGGVYQILLVMQSIYSAKAFKVAFFCPCQSCKPDSNRLLYTFWGEITSNISGGETHLDRALAAISPLSWRPSTTPRWHNHGLIGIATGMIGIIIAITIILLWNE